MEIRGGTPIVRRAAPNTVGRDIVPPIATKFLQISNEGATNVRVYFTKADFDADVALASTDGFFILSPANPFFEGPVELEPATRFDRVWLRAEVGAPAIALIFYGRRG